MMTQERALDILSEAFPNVTVCVDRSLYRHFYGPGHQHRNESWVVVIFVPDDGFQCQIFKGECIGEAMHAAFAKFGMPQPVEVTEAGCVL